jgi:hypothetical protein
MGQVTQISKMSSIWAFTCLSENIIAFSLVNCK